MSGSQLAVFPRELMSPQPVKLLLLQYRQDYRPAHLGNCKTSIRSKVLDAEIRKMSPLEIVAVNLNLIRKPIGSAKGRAAHEWTFRYQLPIMKEINYLGENKRVPLDLKSTVNLPQTTFPMKANLPQNEPKILAKWEVVEDL